VPLREGEAHNVISAVAEEQAARARRENSKPDLRDELMRGIAAARTAERAEAQHAAERAGKMAELRGIRRLPEEQGQIEAATVAS
jgi:hypothetical protein